MDLSWLLSVRGLTRLLGTRFIVVCFGILHTFPGFATEGIGRGGGDVFECDGFLGVGKKVYFADTYEQVSRSEAFVRLLGRVDEQAGLQAALGAIRQRDPEAAEFVEQAIANFEFKDTKELPELPDDITEIPTDCKKKQLAIQDLSTNLRSVIHRHPGRYKKLSPPEKVLFNIHEAFIKAKYVATAAPGLATEEVRNKVAFLAQSASFRIFIDRLACEPAWVPPPRKGPVLIGISMSVTVHEIRSTSSSGHFCVEGGFRREGTAEVEWRASSNGKFSAEVRCGYGECKGRGTFSTLGREISFSLDEVEAGEARWSALEGLYRVTTSVMNAEYVDHAAFLMKRNLERYLNEPNPEKTEKRLQKAKRALIELIQKWEKP